MWVVLTWLCCCRAVRCSCSLGTRRLLSPLRMEHSADDLSQVMWRKITWTGVWAINNHIDLIAPWFWDLLRKKFFLPSETLNLNILLKKVLFYTFLYFIEKMQWNSWKHPTVQEDLSTGWRFSPSSAARRWTREAWSAQALCERWATCCGFFLLSLLWINLRGINLLGLHNGHSKRIVNKLPTHIHRHPLWPESACNFNILHTSWTHGGTLHGLWQAFPHQKSLSSLLWEVGSSLHGCCVPACYLNPDGTHGKKRTCGGRLW